MVVSANDGGVTGVGGSGAIDTKDGNNCLCTWWHAPRRRDRGASIGYESGLREPVEVVLTAAEAVRVWIAAGETVILGGNPRGLGSAIFAHAFQSRRQQITRRPARSVPVCRSVMPIQRKPTRGSPPIAGLLGRSIPTKDMVNVHPSTAGCRRGGAASSLAIKHGC